MRYKDIIRESFESGVTPLYHGTDIKFDGVPSIPNHSGLYGRGIYFYTNPSNAKNFGPFVIKCVATGKLATNSMLDREIHLADEEGYKRSAKYIRATERLIEQGYIGVIDHNIVCIYVREALSRID